MLRQAMPEPAQEEAAGKTDNVRTLTVDVIVNNYNYAEYVGEAIDSALAQTYPAVHVIVVDDGSTDSSREVIASYADAVEAVFKDNGGQASALNAGFARSSADIVIFLDSDDVLVPTIAERVADAFAGSPDAAKVHYPMEVIDGAGRRTGVSKPAPHLPLRSGDLRTPALAFPFDVVWMAMTGNAFASTPLRRVFPIPEDDFPILADWYLNHLAPLLGPVKVLDDVGAYYRIHGRNSYELAEASLNLDHLRQTIICADRMRPYLVSLAREAGVNSPDGEILSVSDVANRLISLRLDPQGHPIENDTVPGLVATGARAVARRFDVRWPLKALFLMWFAGLAVTPRRLVPTVAEPYLFPERRLGLNRLLGTLHKTRFAKAQTTTPH
jgi:glycosyltransferase involved in cell wall biosynthesis